MSNEVCVCEYDGNSTVIFDLAMDGKISWESYLERDSFPSVIQSLNEKNRSSSDE